MLSLQVLNYLLNISLMGLVALVVIYALKLAFGKRMGSRWHYYIWFLFVIRLLIPWGIPSAISIYNISAPIIKHVDISSRIDYYGIGTALGINGQSSEKTDEAAYSSPGANKTPSSSAVEGTGSLAANPRLVVKPELILTIWVSGAGALFFIFSIIAIRFRMRLNKTGPVLDPEIISILEDSKKIMNVKSAVSLIKTTAVPCPSLYGIIKPVILLPQKEMTPDEMRFAFLHELAHLRRKDLAAAFLLNILRSLYWFNPVVWFVISRMKMDREYCCDSLVLQKLDPSERRGYGSALISQLSGRGNKFGLQPSMSLSGGVSTIRKRITRIALFKSKSEKWTVGTVATLLLLSAIILTDPITAFRQTAVSPDPALTAKLLSLQVGGNARPSVYYGDERTEYEVFTDMSIPRIKDRVDFLFINDPSVVGRWKSVDFVEAANDFKPGIKLMKGDLLFTEFIINSDGTLDAPGLHEGCAYARMNWTKGLILNIPVKVASRYEIREIEDKTYLFFEFKNGDYIFRNTTPSYYVFVKES